MKISCSWYTSYSKPCLTFLTKEFVSYSYASDGNRFYSFDDSRIKEKFILL